MDNLQDRNTHRLWSTITPFSRVRKLVLTCALLVVTVVILLHLRFFSGENETSNVTEIKSKTLHEEYRHHIPPARKAHYLPKCILIGVQKGGTGAVVEFLNLHPDVVANHEEMHFFDQDERYTKGLRYYRRHMPLSFPYQIPMEKTPAYFYTEKVAARVYQMNSSMKLLLAVRNPVTRLISAYAMGASVRHMLPIRTTLFDKNDSIIHSMPLYVSTYHIHFSKWLEFFPREQIHIIDGDNFKKDPFTELYKIESFLGIRHRLTKQNKSLYFDAKKGFYCMVYENNRSECLPPNKGIKHPYVSEVDLGRLRKYFEPLNEQFFNLADRRFDWN